MRHLLALLALAALCLCAAPAEALDVKARGEFKANWSYWSNKDFTSSWSGNGEMKHNDLVQRLRMFADFRSSEHARFVLGIEIGDTFWGQRASGGAIGADGKTVEIRRANLEFKWPSRPSLVATVGILGAVFPNAGYFSSAILDDDIIGATLNDRLSDEVSLTLGFYRPADNDFFARNTAGRLSGHGQGVMDAVLLAAPLTFEGFKATPFLVFGFLGANATGGSYSPTSPGGMTAVNGTARGGSAHPWWAGTSLEMGAPGPLAFLADVNYGAINAPERRNDRKGWLVDGALEYRGLRAFVPSVFGWWSSGIDSDVTNGDERMPSIGDDWSAGTMFFGGGRMLDDDLDQSSIGTWGAGVRLARLSLVRDLSHDLFLYRAQGTNAAAAVKDRSSLAGLAYGSDFTDRDVLWGAELNSTYAIMEELSFVVNLALNRAAYDKAVWRGRAGARVDHQEPMFRSTVGMLYKF